MMIDNTEVLVDAARMLQVAAKLLKELAKTTACTQEYENKILSRVQANIDAAVARIPQR